MVDLAGLVLPTFYDGPISVQFDEPAPINRPQEPSASKAFEGTGAVAPEKGQCAPTERSCTLPPVFRRGQKVVAITQKQVPTNWRDRGRGSQVIEVLNAL